MFAYRKLMSMLSSLIVVFSLTFSAFQPVSASAQGEDGIKREVNAESGRVSFIGPESGRVLAASEVLGTFLRPQDPAMALAKRFGPEFGLKNPASELSEMKSSLPGDGRVTVRYQQNYQGIPVISGELIVNTNQNGDLYSMNGEISPNPSLQTQPEIDSAQARISALQVIAKWYQKSLADFVASEPELWIFDESLLQPSTRPVQLVWRMEVTSVDNSIAVRELVLVNAQNGGVSLHFNQIDTAWTATSIEPNQPDQDDPPTETPIPTETPVPTETPAPTEISPSSSESDVVALVVTLYVKASGGNDNNTCLTVALACATINGAISKAAASGDTIRVATGTHTGTGTEVVLINKSVTISGGWDATFTAQSGMSIIDGQAARRVVTVNSNITVTIARSVMQNGYTLQGAGVYNNGTVILNNSAVTGNTATWGGGGGIYNDSESTFTLNNSTVSGNDGTGISNYGTTTLNSSTISSNTNVGIFNSGGPSLDPDATLILNNSTVSRNNLGIFNENAIATLNSSTISANTARFQTGGGVHNTSGGSVILRNTIVAGNLPVSNGEPDCSGPISSNGYNLIGNNSGCTFSASTGDLVGTSASPINPLLNFLQDNGGTTFTHALGAGSPAINMGNPAAPGSGGNACLAIDQRGTVRPVGGRCDIGAYEGSVPFVPWSFVDTYTAGGTATLPGIFLCNESQPNCTNGSNPHADAAHKYAIGTSNLYLSQFNRDSIDNDGMIITSTVHYCDPDYPCPYDNANWTGSQMVYGDANGFPLADDVVAHELTHGVTEYESNLFYYYQSGAINESFSDVFGEYYDQTNGLGNDAVGVKWLLGEDVTGSGTLRNMSNPLAFSDPDKMTSTYYYLGANDNGGVHYNSGINNKAAYLMVDGGSFNGKTVTSLGWVKTAAVYYEAQTNLLSSGADYSDLYYALQQGCTNLIGQKGITSGDCLEVKDAIDAVEMNLQPAPNFNTDAPLCTLAGTYPNTTFADDLEAGTSNWDFATNGGYYRWQYDSPYDEPYAHSGTHFLYADDDPAYVTDATAKLVSVVVPANGYLLFHHAYSLETGYDGGVIEYSTNAGSSWTDAGSLIDGNGYDATLSTISGNPLGGRQAFNGISHGYISTRLNLSSLAGQNVMFRFRMGLDESVYYGGWWLDDIQVYNCVGRTISGNAGTSGVTLSYTDGTAKTVTSLADGSYSLPVSNNWSGTVTPSHSCFTFSPTSRTYSNVTTNQTNQNYTPTLNPASGCANIHINIGGALQGSYALLPGQSQKVTYPLDSGPVKVISTNGIPIVAALRDGLLVNGSLSTFSQLMGLPNEQLSDTYWFPAYVNNSTLNGQLRFANVGVSDTTVTVTIGGVVQGSYLLHPNQMNKLSYMLDAGPVKVQSSGGVPIVAALRDALVVNGGLSTFSQLMGIPDEQLSDTYWFPAYVNNSTLNGQLRFANVGVADTTVTVTIGGVNRGSYLLHPNEMKKVDYPLDAGPVKVQSSGGVPIVAALRDALLVNGSLSTFSQMMGIPDEGLSDTYWIPAYVNNSTLNGQLRFGNVGVADTTVTVTIGGVNRGSYLLHPNEMAKVVYNLDSGPVKLESSGSVPIVAALRDALLVNGSLSTFSQMMGLPDEQLSDTYWIPAYVNNTVLNGQLRFGVP